MKLDEELPERLEGWEDGVVLAFVLSEEDADNLAFLASRRYLLGKPGLKTALGRERVAKLLSHALKVAAWVSAGEVAYRPTGKGG